MPDSSPSLPASTTNSSKTKHKLSLEFGTIEIFEFPITVGDNPHVSSGCPIALDWELEFRTIQPLDSYEKQQQQRRKSAQKDRKKTREQLKLSVQDRAKLLLGAGYSLNEIADATYEADNTKRLRAETNKQQKWDGVHAMMELTGRNLRKLLGQNKSSSNTMKEKSLQSSQAQQQQRGAAMGKRRTSFKALVVSPSA